jgi:drug/metabolite transporter (DMT)-like permease
MLWLLLALASALFTAARNVFFRKLSFTNSQEVVLFSTFFFTSICSLVMLTIIEIPQPEPAFYYSIFTAAFIDVFASALFIVAISKAELGSTFPLIAISPIFLIGTSYLILGEIPTITGVFGIMAIVFGAYLLRVESIKGGLLTPFKLLIREKAPRYMLICAVLFSLMGPFYKKAVIHASALFALAIAHLLVCLFLLIYFVWKKRLAKLMREIRSRPIPFMLTGIVTFLSAITLFLAFEGALAAYVISLKRTSILFTIILGFLIFREKHIMRSLFAGTIMIAGIFLIAI